MVRYSATKPRDLGSIPSAGGCFFFLTFLSVPEAVACFCNLVTKRVKIRKGIKAARVWKATINHHINPPHSLFKPAIAVKGVAKA